MYLTKADYKSRIRLHLLDVLLENISGETEETATAILQNVSTIAEDTIRTKAGVLYSLTGEFALTENRNGYIMSLALSIALYELYQRADDDDIPEKVIKNYDDAITALDEISRGKQPLDLPPRVDETPDPPDGEGADISGTGLRRLGSAKKRTHYI